jgi:hypothetical protein
LTTRLAATPTGPSTSFLSRRRKPSEQPEAAVERFVALLSWMALAVALIAAFLMRHEPRSGNTERKFHRAGRSDRAASA